MNPERYDQVMATFLAASQLNSDRRKDFLDAACRDDVDLLQQVNSLLNHHDSHTISTKPQVAAEIETGNAPVRRNISKVLLSRGLTRATQRPLVVAAILVLSLSVVGLWLNYRIKTTLRSNLADHLQTVRSASISALEEWVAEKKAEVRSWSKQADIRQQVLQLADLHRRQPSSPELLRADAAYQQLLKGLEPVYLRDGSLGIAVVSRDGVNLAHSQSELEGRELTPTDSMYLRRVLQGETILAKPSLRTTHIVGFPPSAEAPAMAVAAPVMDDDHRVVAALVFAFDARAEFADLLTTANLGASAETFAIDDRGLLLSNLKHFAALHDSGLLPDLDDPAMHLEVRDPGNDLSRAKATPERNPLWPLTTMANSVATEQSGMNLDGYRNLVGQVVVGAWQWLPEYGFAVATEILYAEAYAPLRFVRTAFQLLLAIVVLLTTAILWSSGSLARAQREMEGHRRLGQYSLQSLIGQGGMGKVYLARHALLQRPTAVKLFDGEQADRDSVRRFEREVQLTSRLEHPNTIQIYDFGRTSDDLFYYAMELLDGTNLAQLVAAQGRLPPARVIHLLQQVCGSLKEAHDADLIHRDIKPANIMVCRRGGMFDVVKVLDFGLVKELNTNGRIDVEPSQRISGTPRYMAPERLTTPRHVDVRSDLYSLGAVGYFLLTGQEIFADQTGWHVMMRSVQPGTPRPSDVAGIDAPAALDNLIHECLAPVPGDRPPDVATVLRILNGLATEFAWSQDDAAAAWSNPQSLVSRVAGPEEMV